jgi:hypothetical protein
MSRDYFSIETNEYNSYGVCRNSQVLLPIPENVRDVPCEGCARIDECAVRMTECVAFRVWSATGDFLDKDVARLMRVPRGV